MASCSRQPTLSRWVGGARGGWVGWARMSWQRAHQLSAGTLLVAADGATYLCSTHAMQQFGLNSLAW